MRCLPLLECLILMGYIHRLWFMQENCFCGIVNSEISDCNWRAIHHRCCHSLLCLFDPPQSDRELLQGRIKCMLRWKILLARVTKSVSETCAMHCSNVGKSLIPYCAGKWCISGRVEGRWLKGFWWKSILFNLFLRRYSNLSLNTLGLWTTEWKGEKKPTSKPIITWTHSYCTQSHNT